MSKLIAFLLRLIISTITVNVGSFQFAQQSVMRKSFCGVNNSVPIVSSQDSYRTFANSRGAFWADISK